MILIDLKLGILFSNKFRKFDEKGKTCYNFSYPSSAAAVVFGGHLSARAAFRLDRKPPAIRPCV